MFNVGLSVLCFFFGFFSFFEKGLSEESFLSKKEQEIVRQYIVDFDDKSVKDFMKDVRENQNEFSSAFEEVHPLKCIGFIFSDPELRARLERIVEVKGKANVFLSFLRMRITKAKKEGMFDRYLSDFIEALHLDKESFLACLDRKNVRELVQYLIQNAALDVK